jgi:hypothetical protein
MSLKKIMLLGVLAALAAFSFASTAGATTVTCGGVACANNQNITGTSTNAVLTTDSGNISCTHSVVNGRILTNGATPVQTTISRVNFTGCTGTTACTEPSTITSGNVDWTGNVTTSVLTVSNPTIPVNLTGFLCGTCTYSASEVTGNVNGSTVTFNDPLDVTPGGSFTCPGQAVWDATYTVRSTAAGTPLVTVD